MPYFLYLKLLLKYVIHVQWGVKSLSPVDIYPFFLIFSTLWLCKKTRNLSMESSQVNYNFTIFCPKSLLLKYFVLFFCIYFIVDYGLKQV